MMHLKHNDSFKAIMYMYVRSLVRWTTMYHVYHKLYIMHCAQIIVRRVQKYIPDSLYLTTLHRFTLTQHL